MRNGATRRTWPKDLDEEKKKSRRNGIMAPQLPLVQAVLATTQARPKRMPLSFALPRTARLRTDLIVHLAAGRDAERSRGHGRVPGPRRHAESSANVDHATAMPTGLARMLGCRVQRTAVVTSVPFLRSGRRHNTRPGALRTHVLDSLLAIVATVRMNSLSRSNLR